MRKCRSLPLTKSTELLMQANIQKEDFSKPLAFADSRVQLVKGACDHGNRENIIRAAEADGTGGYKDG